MPWDLGDTVPLGISVTSDGSTLVNASTNTLTITRPDGTVETPATTNPSTGVYECLYVPTQEGSHTWRWVTTGPATAHTDAFDVAPASVPLIIGLAEAKAHLSIRATDTGNDDELRSMLEAITAVIEGGDGKDFPGVGPVVRRTTTVRVDGSSPFLLPWPEDAIVSLTSGAHLSDSSSVDLTGCTFTHGILRPPVGSSLPSSPWTLTLVVGRPSLPANIRMGALELLRELWRSKNSNNEPAPFLVPYRVQAWLGANTAGGFA